MIHFIDDARTIYFINDCRSTRNGFKHVTELYINDCFIGEATCYYLNRTWEAYCYQSVMKTCITNLISDFDIEYINYYKAKNNIKKLTANKKEEILTVAHKEPRYKTYIEILNKL